MKKFFTVGLALVCTLFLLTSCGGGGTPTPTSSAPSTSTSSPPVSSSAAQPVTIILGTTTSVSDSGLLDFLLPQFTSKFNIQVKPVAVGSGEAMAMGQRGDADVLIVHSPDAEKKFMDEGYGVVRRNIAYNYYVLVGPASDPALVKGLTITEAFKSIAENPDAIFVSRGDNSGTHTKELSIWKKAGVDDPTAQSMQYLSTGQGMAETLRVTSEKQGYTLTDIATWLATKSSLNLEVMVSESPELLNTYSVIVINPEKFPNTHYEEAMKLADWLVTPEVQKMIADFGKDKYGQDLFFPAITP